MSKPIYANSLNITSDGGNEVVLTFTHKYPAYNTESTKYELDEEIVSAIVIPKSLASQMPNLFNEVLKDGE